jgi:cell division protein FtsA
MEREMTALGLIRNGRLTTGTMLPSGIGTIAGAIMDKYGIKSDLAVELLKYSARLNHTVLSTNPVYIWAENGETHTINEQELVDCVRENINLWLNDLQKTCSPILQAGETTVMITGEGGETNGLDELVQDRLGVSVKKYIPDTLGGRNACLTSCLGLFYAYQDKFPITEATQSSLDLDEFIRHVSYRERSADDSKEHTLTDKLKGLFKEGKK